MVIAFFSIVIVLFCLEEYTKMMFGFWACVTLALYVAVSSVIPWTLLTIARLIDKRRGIEWR